MDKVHIQPLLAHFDAQEAAMLALKSLLHDIGMNFEEDDSRNFTVRIHAATDLLRRLDHDCGLLLARLADTTDFSNGTVTIRRLIAAFEQADPETAETLRRCRRRLLSLRWQVERVAASSSWVISEERRIRHTVFHEAAGMTDSQRYDSSGRTSLSPDSLRFGTRS